MKETAAKLLNRIAEFHADCVLSIANMDKELKIILSALNEKFPISNFIATFLSHIAEGLEHCN